MAKNLLKTGLSFLGTQLGVPSSVTDVGYNLVEAGVKAGQQTINPQSLSTGSSKSPQYQGYTPSESMKGLMQTPSGNRGASHQISGRSKLTQQAFKVVGIDQKELDKLFYLINSKMSVYGQADYYDI